MDNNKQSKPLKHPTGTLVFAWIFIILGAISAWGIVMGIMSMTGMKIPIGRLIVLILLPLIWFFLGYRFLKKYKAYQSEHPEQTIKQSTKTILIIISGIFGIVILTSSIPMIGQNRLNAKLRHYVKEEFADENANVPENPKYVLYDLDGKTFSYPTSHHNEYAAKEAEEVNVIIAYSDGGTKTIGKWYDKGSGENLSDLQTQSASIYAIRLDNWALIDSKSLSVQLKYGENGKNARGMINEGDIRHVLETGSFPEY